MQFDMHYYGTCAMARAAGLNVETAKTIATAAQFVDDNTAREAITFRDGSRIDVEATAHHPLHLSNLNEENQRKVWVPFHFLPGNMGDTYTERLKCRKDSEIVQEMRDHHLSLADRKFAVELIGIAAHVYADTFSHYGFSGVSSRGNKVDNGSFLFHEDVKDLEDTIKDLAPELRAYITKKKDDFFKKNGPHGGLLSNIVGSISEEISGALGHGSVATYPDRPYLVWSFDYEREDTIVGKCSTRNNPITFLAGCRALHGMFQRFMNLRNDLSSKDGRSFDDIAQTVLGILTVQGSKEIRIDAWQDAAAKGTIFGEADNEIPEYKGQS